jgi:hypothetical protein
MKSALAKPLFEPSKNGREDEMCFLDTVLVRPQTTEARRTAKLPGLVHSPIALFELLDTTGLAYR